MNTHYPVDLEAAPEGGFVVTFPGLPFGVSQGDTVADALANAEDALVVVITTLVHDGADVPEPLEGDFAHRVALPEDVALKLLFYRAFKAAGINKAELGRRMGWRTQQVARLFDAAHHTRVDHLFKAIRAVGHRAGFVLEPIAAPAEASPAPVRKPRAATKRQRVTTEAPTMSSAAKGRRKASA